MRNDYVGIIEKAIAEYAGAVSCINSIKGAGKYRDEKIGLVREDVCPPQLAKGYVARAGQIVLIMKTFDEKRVMIADPMTKTGRQPKKDLVAKVEILPITNLRVVDKRAIRELPIL